MIFFYYPLIFPILGLRDLTRAFQSNCQKRNPTKGDWCEKVREDFKKVGLDMTDEHLAAMNSDTYKNI